MPIINPADYTPAVWLKADGNVWQDAARSTPAASDGDTVLAADDYSGNADHFTQSSDSKKFLYKLDQANGKPSIRSDGSSSILRSGSFTLAQPFTLYLVARRLNNATGRLCDGNTVNQGVLKVFDGFSYSLFAGSSDVCANDGGFDEPEIFAAVFNGSSSLLECGLRDAVTGNPGSAGYTAGLCLGASGSESLLFNGDYFEVIACPTAHDLATRDLFREYFRDSTRWFNSTAKVRCVGDSLTAGTGSTAGNEYPTVLGTLLGAGYSVLKDGAGGATAADVDNAFRVNHARYMTGLRTTFAIIWCGTNDVLAGGAGADAYAENASVWAKVRAAGHYVIAFTMIKRGNFDASMETERQAFNTLVRADDSLYDALIELDLLDEFDDTSDTTYFSDGVHLTDAGYAIVAQEVYEAIQGLEGGAPATVGFVDLWRMWGWWSGEAVDIVTGPYRTLALSSHQPGSKASNTHQPGGKAFANHQPGGKVTAGL